MKKIIRLLLCTVLLSTIGAGAARSAAAVDDAFVITGYDVETVISESNTYSVTETIDVYYNKARHGIYRTMNVNDSCSIYDVNVDGHMFEVSEEESMLTIKIGDPDEFVSGNVTYRISYKAEITDSSDIFDEVYYSIIGTGWETSIKSITFSVTLPKEFDERRVGFSTGEYGATGYDMNELKYTVAGNTVSGYMERLEPYEGLTVRIELPEGYFEQGGQLKLPEWVGKLFWAFVWQVVMGK